MATPLASVPVKLTGVVGIVLGGAEVLVILVTLSPDLMLERTCGGAALLATAAVVLGDLVSVTLITRASSTLFIVVQLEGGLELD